VVRAEYEPPPVDSNNDASSAPDADAADNSTSSATSSAAGQPRRGRLLRGLQTDTIPDAPDWARPCSDWVKRFVVDFQQLRQQVGERYETGGEAASSDACIWRNGATGWCSLCIWRPAHQDGPWPVDLVCLSVQGIVGTVQTALVCNQHACRQVCTTVIDPSLKRLVVSGTDIAHHV
jgi:hypothetical protein